MNDQIRTQEEVTVAIKEYTKMYCKLKYSQEIEAFNYKENFKIEEDNFKQDLKEAGVSKQFIELHRSTYEKHLKMNEISINKNKTIEEISEFLFNNIIDTLNKNSSHNNDYYKEQYLNAKDIIIKYYIRYFEIKNEKQKFKNKQSKILSDLVNFIKDEGISFYIIAALYKSIRHNLKLKQFSSNEFAYYEDMYDLIKDEILLELEEISSNKINGCAKIRFV